MLTYEDIEKLIEILNTQHALIVQLYSAMESQLKEFEIMRSSPEWTSDSERIFALAKDTLKLKLEELKTFSRLLSKFYDLQEKLMDTKGRLTIEDIIGEIK